MSVLNVNSTPFRFSSKPNCGNNTHSWLFLFYLLSDRDFPNYLLTGEGAETQMDRFNKNLINKKNLIS